LTQVSQSQFKGRGRGRKGEEKKGKGKEEGVEEEEWKQNRDRQPTSFGLKVALYHSVCKKASDIRLQYICLSSVCPDSQLPAANVIFITCEYNL